MVDNKIIVWGIDGFNSLSLLRSLGSEGLDVLFLIKGKADFASKSKYCKEYVETSSIEEGYKFLMDNFKLEASKPIIFTPGDDIMVFMDRHKSEMEKYFILPGASVQGDTERYTDKNEMTELAQKIGIVCPKSIKVNKKSSIEGVQYPCLIKPGHEKIGHYNEFKFKVCKNEKQLKRLLKYTRSDSEFIVQEFVPCKEELLIYGCRMWDGATVIAGAIIRDRMASAGTSHGYMTKEIPPFVDVNTVEEFLTTIDYHGLFSFEYGINCDKAYFFEVNLRNDGTAPFFCQAGTNLPLAYVYSSIGLDYSEISTEVTETTWFIDEIYDVENVISGKVKRKKWKQDLERATAFKYYDKHDEVPFKIVKRGRAKQIIQNFIKKRFRIYIVFVLDKLKSGK